MLDITMFSLAADMAEKAGLGSVCDYWIRVGKTFAKRIGTENFVGWPQFNIATNECRTALTVEGVVRVMTDMAITDKEGEIIGYVYALVEDPMVACYNRWIAIMGQAIPPIDEQIINYYNENVRPTAVTLFDPMNQTFREEAANYLTVADAPLEAFQIAARSRLGVRRIYKPTLTALDLDERYLVSLLRDHMVVYALAQKGKIEAPEYVKASTLKIR